MVWNAGCVLPCAGRLARDCCVKLEAIKIAEIDSSARASAICSADAWIELFCFFFIGGAPQSRDEEERRPCYLELRERLRNSEALFYTCFQAVFRVEPPLLTEARKRRQHFFENFGHPSSVAAATNGGAGEFQPPCAIQPSHPLRRRRRLRRTRANDE